MRFEVLNIKEVTKTFNRGEVVAVNDVTFSLEEGTILAIVGESGSGKTTLIRLIAGLEIVDEGKIELKGETVSSKSVFLEPEKRTIGMLFQDYALFPHFTVYQNVVYGISKMPNKKERVHEVLSLVGLEGVHNRYPHELSGGQQQRVALARALAPNPQLLILDEPFSNLDVILKAQLKKDIHQILKRTKATVIFVTHDIKDAKTISDEIMVIHKGKVLQHGKTNEVFQNPKNDYVKLLFASV